MAGPPYLVPMLRVGTPPGTLRVPRPGAAQSAATVRPHAERRDEGAIYLVPTRSVGTSLR